MIEVHDRQERGRADREPRAEGSATVRDESPVQRNDRQERSECERTTPPEPRDPGSDEQWDQPREHDTRHVAAARVQIAPEHALAENEPGPGNRAVENVGPYHR